MQNKLFSMHSLLHKPFTFFTPIKMHLLIKNMKMRTNPDPINITIHESTEKRKYSL